MREYRRSDGLGISKNRIFEGNGMGVAAARNAILNMGGNLEYRVDTVLVIVTLAAASTPDGKKKTSPRVWEKACHELREQISPR